MLKAYHAKDVTDSLTMEKGSDAVFPIGVVCETSSIVEQQDTDLDVFFGV